MYHSDKVEKYAGTNQELAADLSNLKYDSLAQILRMLAEKIKSDLERDKSRGRKLLASRLEMVVSGLSAAELELMQAWRICEPYMQKNQK